MEGNYTGHPTAWIRLWGCNLTCGGFNQDNPEESSTWVMEYQNIDMTDVKSLDDLPVLKYGCDSSYSWAKKFSNLSKTGTPDELCQRIEDAMKTPSNPEGRFLHPLSQQWTHMAFTGGEPMISQNAVVEIMQAFALRGNMPKYVTVETNGTQMAKEKFSNYLSGTSETPLARIEDALEESRHSFYMQDLNNECSSNLISIPEQYKALQGIEWFWSVSPKIFVSGEKRENTLKPEVVAKYARLSPHGQLKYVCNGSDKAWAEIEEFTKIYRAAGVNFPVWIMPVGGRKETQEEVQADIAHGAIQRGYNVAARVHCWLFGNTSGT